MRYSGPGPIGVTLTHSYTRSGFDYVDKVDFEGHYTTARVGDSPFGGLSSDDSFYV